MRASRALFQAALAAVVVVTGCRSTMKLTQEQANALGADAKFVRSSEHYCEIAHPADWTAVQFDKTIPAWRTSVIAIGPDLTYTGADEIKVTGSSLQIYHENAELQSADAYVQKRLKKSQSTLGFTIMGQGQTTVNEHACSWCCFSTHTVDPGDVLAYYVIMDDDRVFEIECRCKADKWPGLEKTFGAMVSTFRSTKTKV